MTTFHSFAKINWHLEVVRRRPDGYHELRTIFQTIDLADRIDIEPRADLNGAVAVEVTGAALPADDSNLATRAAHEYLASWGRPGEGVEIRLDKRIPLGRGLGGGSSDAATVLLGMAKVFGREPDAGWFQSAARRLGADVPYFLVGGTALGSGRGDLIQALPDDAELERDLWLILPPFPVSTAQVFGSIDPRLEERAPAEPVRAAVTGRPLPSVESECYRNDLEAPAMRTRSELTAVYTALRQSGARLARMSGSGSAFFAAFDDMAAAPGAVAGLPTGTVWKRVRTMGRETWRRANGLGGREGGG